MKNKNEGVPPKPMTPQCTDTKQVKATFPSGL
jgi:hypothetical protein